MTLTDSKIRSAKSLEKSYKFTDSQGLYLFVSSAGAKLWYFRYSFRGKENRLAFGAYPLVTLSEAREKRNAARKLLISGIPPSQLRSTNDICALLRELIKHPPGHFGYQRSRWGTELLAIKINEIIGCQLHAGTLRHWLPSAGLVWRKAAPTLRIRDPHKDEKMTVIHKALDECNAAHPVFYEDEVDIHLNPQIGADWQVRG